jgi:hypothetical protein
MTSEGVLNFPYYVYPGTPFSGGYTNTTLYNAELLRLRDRLTMLNDPTDSTLLHLTIGAAMEEYLWNKGGSYETLQWQWQQLFPLHLRQYLAKGKPVRHIIISPNKSFEPESFIEPLFIKYTDSEYKWKLCGDRHYYSTTCDCHVYIFCTMMPHNDPRNEDIMIKLHTLHSKMSSPDECELFSPDVYLQTKYDRIFIGDFYSKLRTIVTSYIATGFMTCFSFAVFNQSSDRSCISNFAMFSEITSLVIDPRKCVLAEWSYVPTNYIVNSTIDKVTPISYVDDTISNDAKILVINDGRICCHSAINDKYDTCVKRSKTFFDILLMIQNETKYSYKDFLYFCFNKIQSMDIATKKKILLAKSWVVNLMTEHGLDFQDAFDIYKIIMSTDSEQKNAIMILYNLEITPNDMMFELHVCALLIDKSLEIHSGIDSDDILNIQCPGTSKEKIVING